VGLGESSEHALELIERIVHEATCPVIALLDATDTAWVNEAAKRGIFAYITDGDADQLQSGSTSSFAASPNTTTSRAPSGAAP
jgi:response regulator NasT